MSCLLIAAILAALSLPALAGAQQTSPSRDRSGGGLSQLTAQPAPGSPVESPGDHARPLPSTGYDLIALTAAALAITGAGFVLRRTV